MRRSLRLTLIATGFVIVVFSVFLRNALRAADSGAVKLPAGYIIVQSSISPDGRYGVTAYDNTTNPISADISYKNDVVDLRTGETVGTLPTSKLVRENRGGILPARWSQDSSLMLWETEGRWQPAALVLVRIDDRKITPQMNLLKNVQDAILIRTRTADPKRYAAAKEWNKGSGSAFPDGFTVNVRVEGDKARGGPKENVRGIPIALPFKVHAELTSNPKRLHCPANAQLDAALDGIVKRECRFAVTHFQLRNKPFENATSDSWLELTDPTAAGAAPLDYGDLVSLEGELITQAERGATAYVVRLKKPISIRPLGDLPAEDKVGEVRLFVSDKLDPSNVMASAPPSAKFHVWGTLGYANRPDGLPQVTVSAQSFGFEYR